jgi:hypothetical protein
MSGYFRWHNACKDRSSINLPAYKKVFMKHISPIQNKLAAAPPPIKAAPLPQKSFSSIFASELQSFSIVPSKSSVSSSEKSTISQAGQTAAGVAMTSFSQLFPNLAVPPVGSANEQNMSATSAASGNKIVPGIVNLPISYTSSAAEMDKSPANKKTGSIDIASILNFHNAGTKATRQATQAGTIVSIGDNPNVIISSRSQSRSTEGERYRMETSTQGQKGGALASGVMVAFRIDIG